MATDPTIRGSLKARAAIAGSQTSEIGARIVEKKVALLEFDLTGTRIAVDDYVTIIPASDNVNGLIIQWMSAIITEIVLADTTAPIITVRSTAEDALDTITPTNDDAVGDFVDCGADVKWWGLTDGTDYSSQHVAAGIGVEAALTTAAVEASAAAATGKALLLVEFFQIPSKE